MHGHAHFWRELLVWASLAIPLEFGFDFSGIVDALGTLLGDIAQIIVDVFVFLWNALVFVFGYLLQALVFVYNFFLTIVQDIGKAFKWVWESVIKGFLTKVLNVFLKLRDALQKIFGPVIRFLVKVRAWLDKMFNRFVKPYLTLIHHIRQVLQVFRLLGFKWAAQLDARLAKIEQRIIAAYETLRVPLNQLITWLQLLVDPLGILRRVPVLGGILRNIQEVNNALLQATQRPLTADEDTAQQKDLTQFRRATAKSNWDSYYSQGALPPDMEDSRKLVAQYVAEIRGEDVGTSNV